MERYAYTAAGRRYWALRNRFGQFVDRLGRNRSQFGRLKAEYAAYLEARHRRRDGPGRYRPHTTQVRDLQPERSDAYGNGPRG